jgi:hypothetical protein
LQAAKFYAATGEYEASIMTHTELHAKAKTLEQWKKELEEGEKGEGHDSDSDDTAEAGKKRKAAQQSGRAFGRPWKGRSRLGSEGYSLHEVQSGSSQSPETGMIGR